MSRHQYKTSKRAILAHHEYADLFPLLGGDDLHNLAEDIKVNGLRVPITTYEGRILDGRNRLTACTIAKVKPRFETFTGTDAEALALVVSLNVTRRHLTVVQRAALAIRLLPMEQELARQRMLSGRADPAQKLVEGGEAIERTGKQVGVSRETVRQAAKIAEETPDVLKAMASGIVSSMPDALHLAALPKPRRTRILRRIADGGTDFDFRGGKRTFGFSYLRPSQETNEWYAPEQVIEAARTVMGSIELDPASCPQANRRVRAQRIFTVREDGLKKPWKAESLFLNPPFGLVDNESYVGLWIRKLIGEYEAGRTRQALLIVMATVSHRWFRPLWSFPMCVTFKRLKFVRGSPKNTECRPTFGSAIIYFGPEVKRFALEFAHIGRILVPEGEVTRVLNRS